MIITKRQLRRIIKEAIEMRGPAKPTGQRGILRSLEIRAEHGDIRDPSFFKQMKRNSLYPDLRFMAEFGPYDKGMLDASGDIGMLKDWFVNWYAGGDPYAADDFDDLVEMM